MPYCRPRRRAWLFSHRQQAAVDADGTLRNWFCLRATWASWNQGGIDKFAVGELASCKPAAHGAARLRLSISKYTFQSWT